MDSGVVGEPLCADDEAAYRELADGAIVPDSALARLRALGLVEDHPHTGQPVAMDPRAAIQRLLAEEQARLLASQRRFELLPMLEGLSPAYERNRRFDPMGAEFLYTQAMMNERIGEVTGRAAVELLAAQPALPAQRDPAVSRTGQTRTLAALERGATIRLLYPVTAAADERTQAYAAAVMEAGGEVRALEGEFPRLIIVDGRSLFVEDYVRGQPEQHSGWHVASRSSVAWARHVFDLWWARAMPWAQATATAAATVLADRHMDILDKLNSGLSQEGAARALGLSDRSVNKALAEARTLLGLQSTLQLMTWYGRWLERTSALVKG